LANFATQGLKKYHRNKTMGARFLSLESKTGLDVFSRMPAADPKLDDLYGNVHHAYLR
jgi:hypothetical protein